MQTKERKIFIGLKDIANLPMMMKKAFEENGLKCDYYSWSDLGDNEFGYRKHKTFFRFKHPPPFRIFGKNPFLILSKLLAVIYLLYSIPRYDYFFFMSPMSFLSNNKDLKLIKFFKKKVIIIFTGCTERDVNFNKDDEDYICKRCLDTEHQKWLHCRDTNKKKDQVNRLENYSDIILGQDDSTSYVNDKSKLIWLYSISDYPKKNIDLLEKYNQKELRIIHFPSNPLVKQSHIIVPILQKFVNHKDVRVIIKDGVWERERIEEELSKAHILVNVLGTGYNILAVEAMSYGCTVFNSHPEWFRRNVPDAPIVHITAENLEDTLRHFIDANNRAELRDYAKRSIEYYFKYISPKAFGNHYRKVLEL